jgi:DNA-binding transcriptional LysR family regulator
MLDWNDIRHFLEVAGAGSTLAAARRLGVSQPTVARRVDALEAALGLQLFERLPAGYRPNAAGKELLAAGEEVARTVRRFESAAASHGRRLGGTVRLTTGQVIADLFVAPMLAAFGKRHPDVRVEVFADDRILDLEAGEADLAIRAAPRPAAGQLVCKLLATDPLVLCCSRAYAERCGVPASAADLDGHTLLLNAGPAGDAEITRWMRSAAPNARVGVVAGTTASGVANMRAGLGIGALPARLMAHFPDLVACFEAPPPIKLETWLVTTERLRLDPAIGALFDHVARFR